MSLDNVTRVGRNGFRHSLINGNFLLKSGALATSATESIVEIGASAYALINGTLVTLASGVDMPALVGTVDADMFNVYVFYVNEAGTTRTAMGTEGATLGAVVFPEREDDEAVIGFVIINPTGTGDFVGGTTDLDDATVVPNAVYINTAYPFDPTWSANCAE
jgi:hypothetical protein